jgi:hypothetical protein
VRRRHGSRRSFGINALTDHGKTGVKVPDVVFLPSTVDLRSEIPRRLKANKSDSAELEAGSWTHLGRNAEKMDGSEGCVEFTRIAFVV